MALEPEEAGKSTNCKDYFLSLYPSSKKKKKMILTF